MKIMLDSGAFSAWTRGETLELGAYIKFVERYRGLLDSYVNLDVIPGTRRGKRADLGEVEAAAKVSLANYKEMCAAGLDPIPVFHYGEDPKWLCELLESGATYICLGGTVGVRTTSKQKFLDQCFTVLTDREGRPLVKVHGLGVTEGRFLMRYPWHSVDSTSWCIAPIYGMILVPSVVPGSFSSQIYVADGHLDRRADSRRLEFMPETVQRHVLRFAEGCGFSITDLRNDVYARMAVFARCLVAAQGQVPKRFAHRRVLTGPWVDAAQRVARLQVKPARVSFRTIFAGNVASNPCLQAVLSGAGAEYTLRSYYEHLRDPDTFAAYVEFLNADTRYSTDQRKAPRTDWASMNYHDHRRRLLAARGSAAEGGDEDGAEAVA